MTLNPAFAASVLRRGTPTLSGYVLTPIEQVRLAAVARQRGMSVNCTLARANRFAPIADAFPLTCSLLKPLLRPLLYELWSLHPRITINWPEKQRVRGIPPAEDLTRRSEYPYAEEVFRYERAAWRLIQTLHAFDAPLHNSSSKVGNGPVRGPSARPGASARARRHTAARSAGWRLSGSPDFFAATRWTW